MNDQHTDGGVFRFIIGFVALGTAVGGFMALFFVSIPKGNENALMFALGAVFGWATSVIASEYGSTATGRKVAESAVRQMERRDIASADSPAGTPDDPLSVAGADQGQKPVATTESKP